MEPSRIGDLLQKVGLRTTALPFREVAEETPAKSLVAGGDDLLVVDLPKLQVPNRASGLLEDLPHDALTGTFTAFGSAPGDHPDVAPLGPRRGVHEKDPPLVVLDPARHPEGDPLSNPPSGALEGNLGYGSRTDDPLGPREGLQFCDDLGVERRGWALRGGAHVTAGEPRETL